jgi:hypothetical protein
MGEESVLQHRLSNDYGGRWPFWGNGGLCGEGDPALPADLERDVKQWADQFERLFDWQHGWPNQATADAHRAEGDRLHREIQRALPDDTIAFHYWETSYRHPQ